MAENVFPSIESIAKEVIKESQADFLTQRIKIAEHLVNFPPDKIGDLHWQDWYSSYWKFLILSQYTNDPPQSREKISQQILNFAQNESNPIRKQYAALALLLFGKVQEFNALADKNLWTPNLREDFDTFYKFNSLINFSEALPIRVRLRKNQYFKTFLEKNFAHLIQKYSQIDSVDEKTSPRVKNYKIWYCWLQGENNLPPIVQCCYNSLKMNAGKYKICFINEQNYSDYISLPEHIVKKFKGGGYNTDALFGYS